MLSTVATVFRPAPDSRSFFRAAADLRNGLHQRELWLALGWQDIKQRYSRSVLGPFWITISTGLQAAAMGGFIAMLMNRPVSEFLPYVAVGMIVWNLIHVSIIDGSETSSPTRASSNNSLRH